MILKINDVYKELNNKLCQAVREKDSKPKLSLIRVGHDRGSISFEKSLLKEADKLGIDVTTKVFEAYPSYEDVLTYLEKQNIDDSVNGILIFSPMEVDFDEDIIFSKINPGKDVDGLAGHNLEKLFYGPDYVNLPTTALATLEYLKAITDLRGKDVLIVNRSMIIGKPLALMLTSEDATVTVAHSRSKDLRNKMKNYDIIVSAIGKAKHFKDIEFKEGAIIIDLGMAFEDGKYYGDFDRDEFENIEEVAYLPSIGGIGRLNSIMILRNTYLNGEKDDR